jgi:hypothetical protein
MTCRSGSAIVCGFDTFAAEADRSSRVLILFTLGFYGVLPHVRRRVYAPENLDLE